MITVKELTDRLHYKILTGRYGLSQEIKGVYCGDLLSWVMGKAQEGDAWVTVMGNLNAIAVAVLTDVACIILSESSYLDEDARIKAEQQGVVILQSEESMYDIAIALSKILEKPAVPEQALCEGLS